MKSPVLYTFVSLRGLEARLIGVTEEHEAFGGGWSAIAHLAHPRSSESAHDNER